MIVGLFDDVTCIVALKHSEENWHHKIDTDLPDAFCSEQLLGGGFAPFFSGLKSVRARFAWRMSISIPGLQKDSVNVTWPGAVPGADPNLSREPPRRA